MEQCAEVISRKSVKDLIFKMLDEYKDSASHKLLYKLNDGVRELKSVELVGKTGYWRKLDLYAGPVWECSCCGSSYPDSNIDHSLFKYCMYCGAKLRNESG